ncbi:grainyhead-like, partial [Entomortierella chlamydospora]
MQRQDETPMTYLNKGQYYNVGLKDIEDYDGEVTSVIKVTFHEPSHRRLAARYWSFWLSQQPNPKTARALDIEKASSAGMLEVQSKTFDRISFKWNGKTGAKLMVRFNCLSTDFSRIKGVKGIPLRVHVDTYLEGIGDNNKDGRGERVPMERAFAKIKLFRDKGAERKNKDDHKQLEKMWDKMRGKNADTNPLVSILAPVQSTMIFSECLDHEETGEDETLDLSDTLTNDMAIEEGGGSPSYDVNEGEEVNGGGSHNDSRSSSRLDSEGALGSPSSVGGGGGGEDLGPVAPTSKKRRRITEAGGSPASPGTNINSSNGGLYSPHQSHVSAVPSISSPNAHVTAGADSGLPVTSTGQIMGRDENYVPLLPILSEKLEIQSSTISCVFRKTLKKELLVRVDDAMVAQMTDELDM